jgi:hypothetical protein
MNQAQDSATGWLLLLAGGAVVFYLVSRTLKDAKDDLLAKDVKQGGSTSGGGLVQGIGKLLGGETQFSETVKSEELPLSGGVTEAQPGEVKARLVDPPSGGSVKRALWADTVRLVFEVANATGSVWDGVLRIEVVEDYLVRDSQGSFQTSISVPPGTVERVSVDYRLTGGVMLREPNLFLQVFLGSKHQGSATVEVT